MSPRAILQDIVGTDGVYARIVVAVALVVHAIFNVVAVVVVVAVAVVVLKVVGYDAPDVDLYFELDSVFVFALALAFALAIDIGIAPALTSQF